MLTQKAGSGRTDCFRHVWHPSRATVILAEEAGAWMETDGGPSFSAMELAVTRSGYCSSNRLAEEIDRDHLGRLFHIHVRTQLVLGDGVSHLDSGGQCSGGQSLLLSTPCRNMGVVV